MAPQTTKYRIIRMYRGDKRSHGVRGKRDLTLKEAQAHCHDPETSSSTCTKSGGKARTKAFGPWFDGYEEMS